MHEVNAIAAIAYRDIVKFLRDPARLVSSLIFPVIFIALFGGSMQAGLGEAVGYNLLVFSFTGILGLTLFQSSTLGIVSLIEDRQTDFSQEMFVAPISRYSIVGGKVVGEALVALTQGVAILAFGLLLGVPLSLAQAPALLFAAVVVCLLGGAFGVALLSWVNTQRAANQIFPFLMLPQFFLAGVFAPIQALPWYLEIPSRLAPMRYAVDLLRSVYYAGNPDEARVVLHGTIANLAVIGALFAVFLVFGAWLFVRAERNR